MTPDLRARCAKLAAKFNGGISFPEDIADLAQLYHDGYLAGLEEAARLCDAYAEAHCHAPNIFIEGRVWVLKIVQGASQRAADLKKEPAP